MRSLVAYPRRPNRPLPHLSSQSLKILTIKNQSPPKGGLRSERLFKRSWEYLHGVFRGFESHPSIEVQTAYLNFIALTFSLWLTIVNDLSPARRHHYLLAAGLF